MSPATIFNLHLVLGYVAWVPCALIYIFPRLKSMDRLEAQRAIAVLHSFRFFGLVFILPGVIGNLPSVFTRFAAYGDFATGLLAMLAVYTFRMRPLFWASVVAYNVVGIVDLIGDYYHGWVYGLAANSGELRSTYIIPIIIVPVLMITHIFSAYLLATSSTKTVVSRQAAAAL